MFIQRLSVYIDLQAVTNLLLDINNIDNKIVATITTSFQATGRQYRGCFIPQAVTRGLVLLKMGEIIARNMLS